MGTFCFFPIVYQIPLKTHKCICGNPGRKTSVRPTTFEGVWAPLGFITITRSFGKTGLDNCTSDWNDYYLSHFVKPNKIKKAVEETIKLDNMSKEISKRERLVYFSKRKA